MRKKEEIPGGDNDVGGKGILEDSIPKTKAKSELLKKAVEVPQEPKERPGTVLKRERESQGLSLEIIHEATNIPLDALRAIEEGYTIRMLSPFYFKGFLKMYANYLGIDASEVIEDYKSEELPEHIKQDIGEWEPPQWVINFFTRKRKQQIVIAIGVILALFLFSKIVGFFMKGSSRADIKKDAVKAEIAKKKVVKKVIEKIVVKKTAEKPRVQITQEVPKIIVPKEVPKVEPKEVPKVELKEIPPVLKPVQPVSAVPVPITAEKAITLTVRAKQNSWLSVKADGNIVFQSTLRLGAVETWIADDEIEISGKNVDQLEFELNGKMIGTLGRNDRNAKKIVITKSGLSVKN